MAEQNKSNLWLIIGAVVVVLAVIYWFMSSGTAPDEPAETGAAMPTETMPADPAADPAADAMDGAVSVEPAEPAAPASN
ncbi:hypothetical protein SAMN04487972_11647 [Paracoccus halophilus]|uniref:Uncharacterized protein n=1 Tax=Paracoccus halophilus TaxID=376733 RepID=A0A099F0W6_9RHOB|nr:hypothetical protein [Paracoccus halophilus]KGJ03817.1 hypothetical protein IT41_12835 [Paracoccus halophilus]SFA56988.1 hypothetical protein SAMN04487972_11647 [Paracoccus halophilus]